MYAYIYTHTHALTHAHSHLRSRSHTLTLTLKLDLILDLLFNLVHVMQTCLLSTLSALSVANIAWAPVAIIVFGLLFILQENYSEVSGPIKTARTALRFMSGSSYPCKWVLRAVRVPMHACLRLEIRPTHNLFMLRCSTWCSQASSALLCLCLDSTSPIQRRDIGRAHMQRAEQTSLWRGLAMCARWEAMCTWSADGQTLSAMLGKGATLSFGYAIYFLAGTVKSLNGVSLANLAVRRSGQLSTVARPVSFHDTIVCCVCSVWLVACSLHVCVYIYMHGLIH